MRDWKEKSPSVGFQMCAAEQKVSLAEHFGGYKYCNVFHIVLGISN